jgi:nitrate/TMAO reductase-like tetraheme cytochrome c subunit
MGILKRLWARVRAVPRRTYVFSLAALAVLLIVTGGVVYGWDYTNSPPFCGTTCHTMPPEYAAYQVSPHARVACVECHIGRGFIGNVFTRKAGDMMHVVRYSSNQYTFPLYATTMLPARESCEKCHWPEKFANDKVVDVQHFAGDVQNTPVTTLLVMKTGGGTQREGQGFGIHWHIENDVEFIATDPLKQNIPFIQVTDASGKTTVYRDVEKPLTDDEIAKATKYKMDCIDCHNRVSHSFRSPSQTIDQALALKRIDATIPSIHQKAIDVLGAKYSSFDEADKAIDGLDQYYRQTYPDYYQGGAGSIQSAIKFLKQTYSQLIFPDQSLSWTTHPDNLGHKDAPGCFRCHDGKHFTPDNKQAIRLECNVCHTLPQVAVGNAPAPVVSVTQGTEPESHRTTTWLAQHRTVFDASCQQCHDTRNAGGKDNSSFCSNSACHGTIWTFAGLNAPALAKIFPPPARPQPQPGATPPKIPHPIGGSPDCQICHGPTSLARPYPSDHTGRTNDQCLACHQPTLPPAKPEPLAGGPPAIPHDVTGRNECLGCHAGGASGVPQIPQFHKDYGFANNACLTCHKTALQTAAPATPTPGGGGQLPTPAETPAPSATLQPTPSLPASTTEATTATPTASAGGPPALPSDHAGRTICTACHASGVGGAPKLPADHAGRDDTTCLACHKPK